MNKQQTNKQNSVVSLAEKLGHKDAVGSPCWRFSRHDWRYCDLRSQAEFSSDRGELEVKLEISPCLFQLQ